MNEENKKIKERISAIFPSREVASAVVDLVVHNKPMGWGRKSNAPYFKEIYGQQIKREVDKMIDGGNEIIFKYKVWCGEEEENMTKNTLYNRINQSLRYLIEKMDTLDKKYGKWYETVHIDRTSKLGVIIAYIPGFGKDNHLQAEEIQPRGNNPPWFHKMESWLEGESNAPFIVEGLVLSIEEIKAIKDKLEGLTGIQYHITSSVLKLIKVNE